MLMSFNPPSVLLLEFVSFELLTKPEHSYPMSLYYSALKQSSALNFAPGIYLSEYYLRCKYEC